VAPGLMGGQQLARAAYVHPVAAGDAERAFEGAELEDLLRRAREWFGVARELLLARSFPHTADDKRCTYCASRAVCGTDAAGGSARKVAASDPSSSAARFAALQQPKEDDDDAD